MAHHLVCLKNKAETSNPISPMSAGLLNLSSNHPSSINVIVPRSHKRLPLLSYSKHMIRYCASISLVWTINADSWVCIGSGEAGSPSFTRSTPGLWLRFQSRGNLKENNSKKWLTSIEHSQSIRLVLRLSSVSIFQTTGSSSNI